MFCFTLINKNKQYQKLVDKCHALQAQKEALQSKNFDDRLPYGSGKATLKLNIIELDAMKQGARVQVFLSKQNQYNQAPPEWEFEVKPDATRYALETQQIEISNDVREVIIEIWIEGSGSQSIGKIHISISDLI